MTATVIQHKRLQKYKMKQCIDFDAGKYIYALQEDSFEAFEIIYMHYADKVYSFCMAQTRNKPLSQDIVQDTFLKLWDSRHRLAPDGHLQSFIFTIARHRIIDEFRKQVAQVQFEDYAMLSNLQTAEASPDQQLIYDDYVQRVELCKKRLTRRESEIFEMSREQNISIKDIAKKLNLSPQTVKNHLTSSLKIFRSELLKENFLIPLLIVLSLC